MLLCPAVAFAAPVWEDEAHAPSFQYGQQGGGQPEQQPVQQPYPEPVQRSPLLLPSNQPPNAQAPGQYYNPGQEIRQQPRQQPSMQEQPYEEFPALERGQPQGQQPQRTLPQGRYKPIPPGESEEIPDNSGLNAQNNQNSQKRPVSDYIPPDEMPTKPEEPQDNVNGTGVLLDENGNPIDPNNRPAPEPELPKWVETTGGSIKVLNKIYTKNKELTLKNGVEVKEGSLKIKMEKCFRQPESDKRESSALLLISETFKSQPTKEIFHGWMFSASPAISALEHPLYDVILLGCEDEKKEEPQPPKDSKDVKKDKKDEKKNEPGTESKTPPKKN